MSYTLSIFNSLSLFLLFLLLLLLFPLTYSLSATKYTAAPSFPDCATDKVGEFAKAVGAEGASYAELCLCKGTTIPVSTCSAGATCSSNAAKMEEACACTPSATIFCQETKRTAAPIGTTVVAMRTGCFAYGTRGGVDFMLGVGCAATGTDAQMQLFKGKVCAAGSEFTDADAIAANGPTATAIRPMPSAWVNYTATVSTRYSSTCYGGVQHADTGTATAAANAAANAAPAPAPALGSGEFSDGSSLSVGLAVGVLVTAAAFANLL